eukprot:TRINITY_DN1454_c0_g1_i1.p1 TRINITY_DN1454_c0_g1~~TRINITY_DN1454_c0_g1_i1.p1  ORF type:complete len:53 (+),score=6.18 TRINITY_DN1454_c0_g1_i1:309-467(+)
MQYLINQDYKDPEDNILQVMSNLGEWWHNVGIARFLRDNSTIPIRVFLILNS